MMSETDSNAARERLYRLSRIRRVATVLLDGPGAVMFPNDPKGLKLWLEPTLRMKTCFTASRRTESLAIYCVPNCLERKPSSPVLVSAVAGKVERTNPQFGRNESATGQRLRPLFGNCPKTS